MEEQMDDIIERYFRNELTGAERQDFERRLMADASFRAEVELHRKAMQAVRLKEKQVVLDKLSERGRQIDAQGQGSAPRKWWWGGGAVLAVAALLWWQFGKVGPGQTQPVPSSMPADTLPTAPPNAVPPEKQGTEAPQKIPQKTQPVATTKDRQEQLFAQHFQPYKDETMEPAVRGGEELSASQRFALLYWEGQYAAALEQFGKLPELAQKNDNQLFIKAECLLAADRAGEAAALFAQLQLNGKSRFEETVDWHLALALLKAGEIKQAKEALQYVAASTSSPWQVAAKGLLEQL